MNKFFVCFLFVFGCSCEQIDPGEVGVAVDWGEVQPWTYNEGFHTTSLIGMDVVRMSTRTQIYEMGRSGSDDAQEDRPERSVARGEPIEVVTRDQLTVVISATVQFHLSSASAPSLYRNYRSP